MMLKEFLQITEELQQLLSDLGMQRKLLEWIKVFLVDCPKRAAIKGSHSDWVPITSGIPQGSVLGPTLFTVFVNDMPQKVENCVKLFTEYKTIQLGTNSD